MLELLLIRHGQTDWNAQQKVMGRQPIPLNATGRRQAEAAAAFLAEARLDAIIASPVRRTMQTAEIIAAPHDLAVEEDEGLAEIDYGDWVNMSFAELKELHGETLTRYRLDPGDLMLPGGESMPQVAARVGRTLAAVRERFDDGRACPPYESDCGRGRRVALVSHADIIKIALLDLLGFDLHTLIRFSIDNASITLVRIYPEIGPRLILYNPENGFGKDL